MFQFKYEEHTGKFWRELREKNDEAANKKMDYMNGCWN